MVLFNAGNEPKQKALLIIKKRLICLAIFPTTQFMLMRKAISHTGTAIVYLSVIQSMTGVNLWMEQFPRRNGKDIIKWMKQSIYSIHPMAGCRIATRLLLLLQVIIAQRKMITLLIWRPMEKISGE